VCDDLRVADLLPEDRSSLEDLMCLSPSPAPSRAPRRLRAVHVAALVLVAAAGAGAWLVLARGGGEGASPPRAAPGVPQPGPSATPARVSFVVSGVDSCLRMRVRPSTRAPILDCLQPGVRLLSDGRHATREGRVWRHVYDHLRKRWAWGAAEFLTPA
jgi:hypothetical protein